MDSPLPEPLVVDSTNAELSEKLLPDEKEEVIVDEQEQDQEPWVRGEKQPNECRDGVWVLLFLLQIAVVTAIGIGWGVPAVGGDGNWPSNDEKHIHYINAALLILLLSAGIMAIACVALFAMTKYAAVLIQASLLFNIASSLAFAIVTSVLPIVAGGPIIGFALFAVGAFYAWSVWHIIPWAASNLVAGVTAVRTNLGVVIVGFGMVAATIGFGVIWILALAGTDLHMTTCDESGNCESHLNGVLLAVYLLAFFWTAQVIKNILHVTVAGVVGTWWFAPEDAGSCCSPSVVDSFVRATTTSLGSICLGSLLVAVLQLVRQMVHNARRNGQGNSILLCVMQCLLTLFQSLMEYFNKWGFIYVGLYGYSYADAGKKVMALFRDRGWSAIINDQLVYRVLNWMSLVLGLLGGIVGVLLVKVFPFFLKGVHSNEQSSIAFLLGFLVGTVLSNILFSVIASAVDTVLVCFAEAPLEFRHQHPELSSDMEESWQKAFPTEFRVIADSTVV